MSVKKGTSGQASIHIDAPPAQVYAAVSDVGRMGEWSPECRRCEWLDGASGPAVGARFKGTNRRGLIRWTTKARVVTAETGREFAFTTDLVRWTYRFDAEDGGTRVSESFEMEKDEPLLFDWGQRYVMRIRDRRADLEQGMGATLARVKVAVEANSGRE